LAAPLTRRIHNRHIAGDYVARHHWSRQISLSFFIFERIL